MHQLPDLPVCFQHQHAIPLTSLYLLFTNTKTKPSSKDKPACEQRASQTHQDILDKHYIHKWTQIVRCKEKEKKKRNEKANKALRVYMKDKLWLRDNRRKYDR